MPRSLTLTGRSSVPSPRAQAVGTRRQKELLKSLFCRRVPSGFRPCGLSTCALTQLSCSCRVI
ncbi:MAG TPA: hypothetical protein P5215_02930 [Bacteroidales bacterium]|nr:hypothetical protein [Bacteroidales bacterium]